MTENELYEKFQYWKKRNYVTQPDVSLLLWYAIKWAYNLRKKEEKFQQAVSQAVEKAQKAANHKAAKSK